MLFSFLRCLWCLYIACLQENPLLTLHFVGENSVRGGSHLSGRQPVRGEAGLPHCSGAGPPASGTLWGWELVEGLHPQSGATLILPEEDLGCGCSWP